MVESRIGEEGDFEMIMVLIVSNLDSLVYLLGHIFERGRDIRGVGILFITSLGHTFWSVSSDMLS